MRLQKALNSGYFLLSSLNCCFQCVKIEVSYDNQDQIITLLERYFHYFIFKITLNKSIKRHLFSSKNSSIFSIKIGTGYTILGVSADLLRFGFFEI